MIAETPATTVVWVTTVTLHAVMAKLKQQQVVTTTLTGKLASAAPHHRLLALNVGVIPHIVNQTLLILLVEGVAEQPIPTQIPNRHPILIQNQLRIQILNRHLIPAMVYLAPLA